jgi:hypothetical protein
VLGEHPTGVRRGHAAGEPVEEASAERGLELPHVLGECRLAQMQRLGRPVEAPGPRDREEDLELSECHIGVPLWGRSELPIGAYPTFGPRVEGMRGPADGGPMTPGPAVARHDRTKERQRMIFQQFLYPRTGCAAYVFG